MSAAVLPSAPASGRTFAFGAVLVAMLGAFGLRLWLGAGLPLWLDESWTGMIATQPDAASFWREAWLDCNPPLYYAVMACWTALVGASDVALRLPSLVFVTSAALLPLFIRLPGLPPVLRLGWAVLIALWAPGFELAVDARGYGLLYLLSTAQLMAFAALMIAPDRQRALRWASLSALAGLTHYHALLVGGLQGLALLIYHRGTALRLWPAALAFIPCFGWLAFHAPRLADYARPDVAWYEPMTPALASGFVHYGFGLSGKGGALGVIALILATALLSLGKGAAAAARAHPIWRIAAGISFLGLSGELLLSSIKPLLTDRYLVPLVPGLLLGLVLAIGHWAKGKAGLVGLAVLFVLMLDPAGMRARLVAKTSYGFAEASDFLAQQRPARLFFVWDHPAARILDRGSLAKLGGFFLKREGQAVRVTGLVLTPGEDGNQRLRQIAGDQGAVLWIYNRARASAARGLPPKPSRWPGRDCFWSRGRFVGTFACGPSHSPRPLR